MATFHEPLELQYWLVNTLAGSMEIFIFLAFIFISALAAKFRMNGTVSLIFMALFGVLMSSFFPAFYLVILVLTGMITFVSISRVVKS